MIKQLFLKQQQNSDTKSNRKLEIGPGKKRLEGFETLNVVKTYNTDHVADASNTLPFEDQTFCYIYASHILEHIPWYKVEDTIREWTRVLKTGGTLEIWIPDGLKIAKAFVEAEENKNIDYLDDNWFKMNPEKDVCKWASGRIFTYGDGSGDTCHHNWHHAIFSERYIRKILTIFGYNNIQRLHKNNKQDHGWINMGFKATKL